MSDEYKDAVEHEFAKYLCGLWGKGFHHEYAISGHSSWNRWRAKSDVSLVWSCKSLKEAADNYSWGSDATSVEYLKHCRELQDSIAKRDSSAAAKCCVDIFRWGGVSRNIRSDRSTAWVRRAECLSLLVEKVEMAVELLNASNKSPLTRFDGDDLLMNSSLTKVYAAADPSGGIAIYDGRVGAALCLLVRMFLSSRDKALIPAELMFGWGAPSSKDAAKRRLRDPSDAHYRFNKLPNTSVDPRADLTRADQSRRLNSLLAKAVEMIKYTDPSASPQRFEQALFMVGYSLRG